MPDTATAAPVADAEPVYSTTPVFAASTPILIGGERVFALDGRTIDAVNPANGELITTFPRCGAADVELAVSAASEAFPAWSRLTPEQRGARLFALADAVEARADELAATDSIDNGSPRREARRDVDIALHQLRYFAGVVLEVRGETVPSVPDRLVYTLRQPFGVTLRLGAFNHPLMFTLGKIAASLAAGNTVIVKPSEFTSLSTLALADTISETLPPGVVNVLTGFGNEVGDALVVHPDIWRIAFIGSEPTGRRIQARAAEGGVKSVTLELGGKNPLVIFPDADLDVAVNAAVRGMNLNWQGQSCGSTSRLLVHRSMHDRMVERIAQRFDGMVSGSPDDPKTNTGSMVSEAQMNKALGYIDIGLEEGASLVVGGHRVTDGELRRGFFLRPTLFNNVDPAGRLANEEIFGPVLAAIPFDTYDEALSLANATRYGLTASVFTNDLSTAHRFARDVQAGYVWVNEVGPHIAGTGYGGVKNSGIGREEGIEEILSYTQTKTVSVRLL